MHSEDLKCGKYYKFTYFDLCEIIFKFKRIQNNSLILDCYWCISNKQYYLRERLFIYDDYDYKEVEVCDFVEYLPHNHTERINYRNQRIKKLLSNEI